MALGMLSNFDLAALPVDGAESQHLQIEAMKLAFADTYRHVAEPSAMEVTPQELLSDAYLAERARCIDPQRAQEFGPGNPPKGGTIYLSAADERGMMVSFIQSNYMGFGSGVVVPGFGLSLQNRGVCFSLDAASPNVVAPGKRPFHTIIPGMLTRPKVAAAEPAAGEERPVQHEAVMAFGVMGGNMQPQGHLQTLVRMLDHAQNPQAACDAPRWRFDRGLDLSVEPEMNPATVQGLLARGHRIGTVADSYMDFGSGQFIWRLGDPATQGYVGASDSRRDGLVAGF
jgi:gamma-glutamyltranspeptidase/glutathione hydrolase